MRLGPRLVNGLLTLGSIFACLIAAEIVLRVLPVNEGFDFLDTDAADPVLRAAPNRDVVWSKRWNFDQARRLHINNAGFRNDQDYTDRRDKPLVAVVGDSYVEAAQVSYAESFYGRLAEALAPHAEVYSFGFSGAAPSQYLIWARHAREAFGADYLAISVVGNDYDESLARYKQEPGFFYYDDCGGGTLCPTLVERHRGPFLALAKSSALVRYVVYNLDGMHVLDNAVALWKGMFATAAEPAYVGNVPAEAGERKLQDSRLAVDLFLKDILDYADLPAERITFVVDGRVYGDAAAFDRSYFGTMRAYFIATARAAGFPVIDLRPVFARHYAAYGSRFEVPRDGHWNALGHALVAAALADHYRFLVR